METWGEFESFIHACLLLTTGPVQTWLYSEECKELISLWGQGWRISSTEHFVFSGHRQWCLSRLCSAGPKVPSLLLLLLEHTHTHAQKFADKHAGIPVKTPTDSSLIQVNNTCPKRTAHTHQLPTGWSSVLNKSLKIEKMGGFTVNRSHPGTSESDTCQPMFA